MKFQYYLTLIASILLLTNARSQTLEDLDRIYGYDPTLYNGKVYRYHVQGRSSGTPFLSSQDFLSGSLKIKDVLYTDLHLNYDIYNQQVVYQFTNKSDGINRLIVSDAWLQSFTLEDSYFEVHVFDGAQKIYKVLGKNPYRVMYHYIKELKVDNQVGSNRLIFSSPLRTSYLYDGSTILKYANNRSFLKHFNKEMHARIKRYFRENRVNIKKANDNEILELLAFINSNV